MAGPPPKVCFTSAHLALTYRLKLLWISPVDAALTWTFGSAGFRTSPIRIGIAQAINLRSRGALCQNPATGVHIWRRRFSGVIESGDSPICANIGGEGIGSGIESGTMSATGF